jgi:hypothetical protein
MSEPDLEAPSTASPGLRAAGFLCAALGALLAGVATMLTWITEATNQPVVVQTTYKGVDLLDGKVALALAVVVLVAILASRVGAGPGARRGAAIIVVICSFSLIGLSGAAVVTASSRFVQPVKVGAGPWLALAGGVLALAGGIMTLAWASAANPASDAELQPDGSTD